jgi:hypothetical protein
MPEMMILVLLTVHKYVFRSLENGPPLFSLLYPKRDRGHYFLGPNLLVQIYSSPKLNHATGIISY